MMDAIPFNALQVALSFVKSVQFAFRAARGACVIWPGVNRLAATIYGVGDVRVPAADPL